MLEREGGLPVYARTFSGTVYGIDGISVTVEVDLANGLPQFDIVGLGGSAVKESRDRVRAALRNSEFTFPMQRITVNLAPADLRKEGSGFDLAIAMGILVASEQMPLREEKIMILGELALDGSLRSIPGVLPILLEARQHGFTHVILPYDNREEASLVDVVVLPARDLKQAVSFWMKPESSEGWRSDGISETADGKPALLNRRNAEPVHDFSDVLGQSYVKRGLEVAAAGFHNVLLVGPPGSGKTMLANCLPSIMPALSVEEAYDVTKIYSITGMLTRQSGLIRERPFRAPHHTITSAALAGGGAQSPRPGECSLAHNGILFLDEMPEFSRRVLEVLRQPLEAGQVTIGRAKQVFTYPARFLLVGSLNPCPCGFYGSADQRECTCTPQQVKNYRARLSGPLLDRIDIHLEVPRVSVELLGERIIEESSQVIRNRVELTRRTQAERFSQRKDFPFNSGMNGREIRQHVQVDQAGRDLLRAAFEKLGLSARAYDRILKVARTIADLELSEQVEAAHVAEAIRYRALDRNVVG